MSVDQVADRQRCLLLAVAALSLIAGLLHLWEMPDHFEEWWGYGGFFLLAATAQMFYAPFLLRWPSRTVMLLGIAGNSAIVLLYLFAWTVNASLPGPEAGEREHAGLINACATSSAAIVVALAALVVLGSARERTTPIGLFFSAVLLLTAHAPHLLLLLLALL